MIGERIGPYRVLEMVGIGGMGTVWRATDEFLDRDVALKVVRPELLAKPGLADRFRAEAIVLARLQHPNIGGLYGVERRGEEYVMVMEFVDGRPLDHWLDQHGPFGWADASRLVRNVLDALEHAHERGVIHRDIKPANVMLTRQGRVKVMDFGIARLVGGQRLTSTGAAVGTPSYMSPEQLLGQEIDGRSDVYAVGTLLFELVTTHVPFEAPGDYLRMIAQLQQEPPPPSTYDASLPAGLDAIVARALAKEPDQRFANAGEFRDALDALERELGVWRAPVTPIAPMPSVGGRGAPTPTTPMPLTGTRPAATAGGAAQSAAPFAAPAAAVLTPADATPLPLPTTGATPPITPLPPVGSIAAEIAGGAVAPTTAGIAALPTPAAVPAVGAPSAPAARRPWALVAAGIALVAAVGVYVTRAGEPTGTTGLAARVAADTMPAIAPTDSAALAGVAPPAVAAVDSALVADSLALEARAKAMADSVKAARTADSLAAVRKDSVAAARRLASAWERAARDGAARCVTIIDQRDVAAMRELLGGSRDRLIDLARKGTLSATGPLGIEITRDVDRTTATFRALLRPNAAGEGPPFTANIRAVVVRTGDMPTLRSCVIDGDGGIR
jgi:serine/threonine-protein kinase